MRPALSIEPLNEGRLDRKEPMDAAIIILITIPIAAVIFADLKNLNRNNK